MELKVYYEDGTQKIGLNEEEKTQLWNCLGLKDVPGMGEKEKERKLQKIFDIHFNRPIYNNEYKHRHWKARSLGLKEYPEELYSDGGHSDEARDLAIHEEEVRAEILKRMESDQAQLLIGVVLDGISKKEYAARVGIKPHALSHRLGTAKKKL